MSSQQQTINTLFNRINVGTESSSTLKADSSKSPSDQLVLARKRLDLTIDNFVKKRPQELTFVTRKIENVEVDKKLKEIMKINGNLRINGILYKSDIKDMEYLEELGNGTCGHVIKMKHKPSDEIIAVKQMRRSGNSEDNKRILMDIEVILKSHDCQYIVKCLGCFITDSEVWICMELMTTCFDKLLKRLRQPIPEIILGKVTVATVEALSYLKDKHGVIHRDVKPSNILVDTNGLIKLCDFGISGRLKDSMAQTRSTGCAAYLAPERIEPDSNNPDYDIRADVWSLGISLVELATGVFPYQDCKTDFEVLTKVIGQDPPRLPNTFSIEFRDFIKCCLIKDYKQRPKYGKLKGHVFIQKFKTENINVGQWVVNALGKIDPKHITSSIRDTNVPSSSTSFNHINSRESSSFQKTDDKNLVSISNGIITKNILKTTDSSIVKLTPMESLNKGHMSRLATFQSSQRSAVDRSNFPISSNYYSSLASKPNYSVLSRTAYNRYNDHSDQRIPSSSQRVNVETNPNVHKYSNSPYKTLCDSRWRSASGSPLPIRDYRSDKQQFSGNTSPIIMQRYFHQQKQQQLAKEADASGKKRFGCNTKFHLNDGDSYNLRNQSPDPPPRLNRGLGYDTHSTQPALQRQFLFPNTSPNFNRRFVSTPPVPPRRLSDTSNSTPNSPQFLRTQFRYTPEPQRRIFYFNDIT